MRPGSFVFDDGRGERIRTSDLLNPIQIMAMRLAEWAFESDIAMRLAKGFCSLSRFVPLQTQAGTQFASTHHGRPCLLYGKPVAAHRCAFLLSRRGSYAPGNKN